MVKIVEGNNELNIEMIPIATPSFSYGACWGEIHTCPESSAYDYPDLHWTIRNEQSEAVTHHLQIWQRRYNTYLGKWEAPVALVPDQTNEPVSLDLTLQAGQSYVFNFTGHYNWGGWGCYPRIFAHSQMHYWLQDEEGNMSTEILLERA